MFFVGHTPNQKVLCELGIKGQGVAFHWWGIVLVLQQGNHVIDGTHLGVEGLHELLQVRNNLVRRWWMEWRQTSSRPLGLWQGHVVDLKNIPSTTLKKNMYIESVCRSVEI